MSTEASAWRDHSADLTGADQALFVDVGYQGCTERFIANPSSANTIWVNPFGNPAVANGKGSFSLAPGAYWASKCTNAIHVLGTTADHVTAGER